MMAPAIIPLRMTLSNGMVGMSFLAWLGGAKALMLKGVTPCVKRPWSAWSACLIGTTIPMLESWL